jgi:hypothetical protein
MLVIQAGTPAIIFPHDSRTSELCAATGIPNFPWSRINSSTTLDYIIRELEFDGAHFDQCRMNLLRNYVEVIESWGVSTPNQMAALLKAAKIDRENKD